MAHEGTGAVSVERLLGGELAAAAEETLVGVWFDAFYPALAAQLATAHGLLELYWDLRHERLTAPATGDSLAVLISERFGADGGSLGEPFPGERRGFSGETNVTAWVEHLLGAELSSVAGAETVEAGFDGSGPVPAVRVATAQVLLALCWELRHQRPEQAVTGDDASLEWVSVLLSASAGSDPRPGDFAGTGRTGTRPPQSFTRSRTSVPRPC
jgi:hypothetical protein